MNKLRLNLVFALLISSLGTSYLALAQSTTGLPTTTTTSQPTTTTQTTSTTPTDPNAPDNPVLYNPSILSGPSATVTPVEQTPTPTTDPNGTTSGTTTTPTTTTRPPTTPTRTPPRTTTPTPTTPEQPVESTNCPPINPIEPNQVECPKVETHNIIPVLPYFTFGGAILMMFLFWGLMSILSRSQTKTEKQFAQKHLANEHQKKVAADRQKTYMDLMDFATQELSSSNPFDQKSFDQLNSKVALLGSPEMQKISNSLGEAMRSDNRSEMKTQLKLLSARIKLEL